MYQYRGPQALKHALIDAVLVLKPLPICLRWSLNEKPKKMSLIHKVTGRRKGRLSFVSHGSVMTVVDELSCEARLPLSGVAPQAKTEIHGLSPQREKRIVEATGAMPGAGESQPPCGR